MPQNIEQACALGFVFRDFLCRIKNFIPLTVNRKMLSVPGMEPDPAVAASDIVNNALHFFQGCSAYTTSFNEA